MCKKLLIAAVALVVGLSVVKHTSFGSLLQVWWKDARASVEKQIPIEVEIKQLAIEIDKIERDIRKNASVLAKNETDCVEFEGQVADLQAKQKQLKEAIAGLRPLVADDSTERVSFKGVSYRPYELRRKLDAAVIAYTTHEAELKAKERLLTGKQRTLAANFQRVSAMRAQQQELRVTLSQLETDLQLVRLEQMEAKVDLDESQVGKCNERVASIRKRLNQAKAEIKYATKLGLGTDAALDTEPKTTEEVLKAADRVLQETEPQKVATKK